MYQECILDNQSHWGVAGTSTELYTLLESTLRRVNVRQTVQYRQLYILKIQENFKGRAERETKIFLIIRKINPKGKRHSKASDTLKGWNIKLFDITEAKLINQAQNHKCLEFI